MKVNNIQGDIFEHLEPGDAVAHGANCRGVMGAGVAKPIGEMYPTNLAVYKFLCNAGRFVPGDCLVVPDGAQIVFNLATQYYPGADARYEYIRAAAAKMYEEAVHGGLAGGFPIKKIKTVRMGSGIGGLDWGRVEEILVNTGANFEPFALELDVFYF